MTDTITLDKTYIAGTYARYPVELVSGKGSLLTDAAGKTYIDMGTGIAVNGFGVADDAWVAAVTAQLTALPHTSNLYYTAPGAELAAMLCRKTGMKKVFFANSGAEVNECAVKVARKYAAEKHGIQNPTVVTLKNSFHGRTITMLSATGQDHYHELFTPMTPGFLYLEPGDMASLRALAEKETPAAVLIECVQGEGGVIPLDPAFVRELAVFCREKDVLLMVDEVQTGNGRTGTLYAYQQYGVTPDVVTTAKGLGGGLPIGACLLGEKVQDIFAPGDNGSTFGANPAVCAGALSILSRLDDDLLAGVRARSEYIIKELTGAPGITSVTGLGLMLGLQTVRPAGEVVARAMEKGVLCLTAKDKVRLLPALNIPPELLKDAVCVLKEACAL